MNLPIEFCFEMDFFVIFSAVGLFVITIFLDPLRCNFIALNNSRHALKLYRQLRNPDAPSNADPVRSDPELHKQICLDMVCNHYFFGPWCNLGYLRAVYNNLSPATFLNDFPYNNFSRADDSAEKIYPYTRREFYVDNSHFLEYVFPCPLMEGLFDRNDTSLTWLFVSKEYNVGPFVEFHMPGRFMIAYPSPNFPYDIILAEEPAIAYTAPAFNVEVYYLRLRKHIERAKNNDIDPLCKLISEEYDQPNNQHHRLCVAVSRSLFFEDLIEYPNEFKTSPCSIREVSFKTSEALEEAGKQKYYEHVTRCSSTYMYPPYQECSLYISRSYLSNAVFLYEEDSPNGNMYLESLNTNISVADELDSFKFVEY